jgi:hypothetical protein
VARNRREQHQPIAACWETGMESHRYDRLMPQLTGEQYWWRGTLCYYNHLIDSLSWRLLRSRSLRQLAVGALSTCSKSHVGLLHSTQ